MKVILMLGLLAVSTGACADDPAQVPAPDFKAANQAEVQQGLAAARAATARFHRFDVATSSGYTHLFMDMCMEEQGPNARGGMGFHYVDLSLLDATLDPRRPEAILYERAPSGELRMVGLEYVIPATAWSSSVPPTLFGENLRLNSFGLWALHVWLWKSNPSGMFEDWNPTVSCPTPSAAMVH